MAERSPRTSSGPASAASAKRTSRARTAWRSSCSSSREPPGDWRAGIFHICLAVGDVERSPSASRAAGGRRTSRVWQIFPGEPYRTCYCEDPFGNAIELYSHSHERTWANRS